ncbi:MAG: hypothetical protein ABIP94_10740 [Planctomycetota bacterium]
MKHAVRSTLICLGLGVVGQRLLQLAAFVCIGRALGVDRLGLYAQGLALAGLLGVLASAGVRNLLARAVARNPAGARQLVLTAVRMRLGVGTALAAAATGLAWTTAADPWFWTVCALQVLPSAFDLKNLLDAAGRTRAEVALEVGAAAGQLVFVLLWLAAGGSDLTVLAAIALGSRCLYAIGAVAAIARLPGNEPDRAQPALAQRELVLPRLGDRIGIALAHSAHEAMATGDVWLVAACFGDGTAGLYAVAARFATAALLPSAQLARLLLPHMLHASSVGDPSRTFGTAWRATLLATLPMCAGGVAVAGPLCGLSGPEFTAAGPALVLLLFAGCLQHIGWQCSHALLASRRDAAYARSMLWPAVMHACLLGGSAAWFASAHASQNARLAAACAALAHAVYALAGWRSAHRGSQTAAPARLTGVVAVTAATGLFAALPRACCDGALLLPMQLLAGGLAFGFGLWFIELRGRLRQIGDGLVSASGFRS